MARPHLVVCTLAMAVAAMLVAPAAARQPFRTNGARPNIIHVLADDLGHNDIGFMNGNITHTPNLNRFRQHAIMLTSHYVFKVCSPTRTMLQTGRYTFTYGYYSNNDADGPNGGIPPQLTIMPSDLKKANYSTHGIGKWHCGFRVREQTPTYRGYDTWLGYSHAEESYYHQVFGGVNPTDDACGKAKCCGTDLLEGNQPNDIGPSHRNGTYSTFLYTERAIELIKNHDPSQPFMLFLPYQNIHGPTSAPDRFLKPFPTTMYPQRRKVSGCLSALDEGFGNLTDALRAAGIWENTVVLFHSDNGGPVGGDGTGPNNYPFRGGKWTFWEGGVRVITMLGGGFIPKELHGTTWDGLAHVTDWRTTWAGLAGVNVTGLGLDGFDIFDAILNNKTSPRTEVVHSIIKPPFNNATCNAKGMQKVHDLCGAALRMGKYKLVIGYAGFPDLIMPMPHNGHGAVSEKPINPEDPTLKCAQNCLFDLEADPGETTDIKDKFPSVYKQLMARHDFWVSQGIDRLNPGGPDDPRMCQKVEEVGWWVPYQD